MKKFYLLNSLITCFLFLSVLASAQISIVGSDLEPFFKDGGKYTTYYDDNTKSVNIGSPGQTSWDFSGLVATSQKPVFGKPVATSPYAADFPEAQYASNYEETDSKGYYTNTWIYSSIGAEYTTIGTASESMTSSGKVLTKIKFLPVWVHYKFPLQMGYSYTYTGSQNFTNSMNIPGYGEYVSTGTQTVDETQTVDAYGVVKLPNGKTMDALRIKQLKVTNDGKESKTTLTYNIFTKAGHVVSIDVSDLNATSGVVSATKVKWEIIEVGSQPTEGVLAPTLLTTKIEGKQVVVNWTDNSNNETAFVVERAQSGSNNFAALATTQANVKTYTDNTAVEGIAYSYRVKAVGTNVSSDYSNVATATVPLTVEVIAPTGLTVVVESNTIKLSWTDNASNETAFVVERSEVGSTTFSAIATLASNSSTYTDSNAPLNKLFTYRIKATGATTSSAYSNLASTTVMIVDVVQAPKNLTATVVAGTIVLGWTDSSNNETGFVIERSESAASGFLAIANAPSGATSFTDGNPVAGVVYSYRVKAINTTTASSSGYSNVASGEIPKPIKVEAPTSLVASASVASIGLTWTDNSNNELAFLVERSEGGNNNFVKIGEVPSNTTTYTDMSAVAGTTYNYRVKAMLNTVSSDYSNTGAATIAVVVQTVNAPSGLTVSTTNDAVVLTWTDNSDNEHGFVIERAVGGSTDFVQVVQLNRNETTYALVDLEIGIKYTFRVKAIGQGIVSGYSNTVDVELQNTGIASLNHFAIRNYPNPFTESTVVEFELSTKGNVELILSDLLGKTIERRNVVLNKGIQKIKFDRNGLPAGIYTYTIKANGFSTAHKLLIK